MPPSLVVADAAYKAYPGGVIAVRCSDWMGAARGTLSSEADTRSATGTVVRDSQTVTTSIFSNSTGAFQEADDTLEIDLSTLPLEIDMTYLVLASYLIEGDWDVTNEDTLRSGTQEYFNAACDFRWYGDSVNYLSDADTSNFSYLPRLLDQYRIGSAGYVGDVVGNEVLTWRAYAQDGTTIEWLLDQIYLVPHVASGIHGQWEANDFAFVPGTAYTFGSYPLDDGSFVDGADGGDDQGKFTLHPYPLREPTRSNDGGGDYQQKASSATAEYIARVVADGDFYGLSNTTQPYPDNEPGSSFAYGLHGPFFVPQQTWLEDDFTRSLGDGNYAGADNHFVGGHWGKTPEGFGWACEGASGPSTVGGNRIGKAIWVDGDEGAITIKRVFQADDEAVACALTPIPGSVNTLGGQIVCDNLRTSGTFRADIDVTAGSGTASLMISSTVPGDYPTAADTRLFIWVDVVAKTWELRFTNSDTLYGPVDISSWFVHDGTSLLGWRLEILRYRVRVRVWDASGAEPGTWDYDDFRPVYIPFSRYDYPYSDDLGISLYETDSLTLYLEFRVKDVTTTDGYHAWVDDVVVTHDPIGSADSAYASIERPEGNEVGSIELPVGCWHLVYWGTQDWTEFLVGDGPYLEFSAKSWNETTAAELQRSESVWWYFRSNHAVLIPMNWRSSTREGGWKRVLRGNNPV